MYKMVLLYIKAVHKFVTKVFIILNDTAVFAASMKK